MWVSNSFPQFYGPPNPKTVAKLKAIKEKHQPAMDDIYRRAREYAEERNERLRRIKNR